MTKILVGIASINPDPRFKRDLGPFLEEAGKKYKVEEFWVGGRKLVDAQNTICEYFLDRDFDYLLTLEEDHWGHKIEMLDALIHANTFVCGIKYHSRHFPYFVTLMNRAKEGDQEGFRSVATDKDYEFCDLVPFGMTLIARETFDYLEKPYFQKNKGLYGIFGATDVDFCDRLIKAGIQPKGCFKYTLPHRDITEENILEKVHEGVVQISDHLQGAYV